MEERVARASIILASGSLASLLINSIGSILLARILGPERYGLIAVSMILPNLLLAMLDLGLNAAATRYTSARRLDLVRISAILKILLTLIVGASVYALAPLFARAVDKEVTDLIRILSIFTAASFLLSFSQHALIGSGRYHLSSLSSIALSIAKVSLALYFAPRGVEWVLVGYSAASALVALPATMYVLRELWPLSLSRGGAAEVLSYSLPLHLPTIIWWGSNNLLYALAARVSSEAELGNYSVALALMMPVNYALGSIASALLSVLPSLDEEERKRTVVRIISTTSFFAPAMSLSMGFASEFLIAVLYGRGYELSHIYVILLSLTYLLAPLGSLVWTSYFSSIGRSGVVLRASVAQALLGSPIQATLIIAYGLPGHIIGGIVSSMIASLYMLRIALTDQKISLTLPLRALAPTVLAAVASLPFFLGDYPPVLAPAVFLAILSLTAPLLAEEELAGTARALRSVRMLSPLSELVEVEARAAETLWGTRKRGEE